MLPSLCSFSLSFGPPGPVAEEGVGSPEIVLLSVPCWESRLWPKRAPWVVLCPFTCFISQHAGLQGRLESWSEKSHLTEVKTEALGISAVLVVEVTWGPRLPEAKWSNLLQCSVTLPGALSPKVVCVCVLCLARTALQWALIP